MQTKLASCFSGSALWLAAGLALAGSAAVGCGNFYGLTERESGAGAGGEADAGEPGASPEAAGAGGQAAGGQVGSTGGEVAAGGAGASSYEAGGAGGADSVDTSPVQILFDGPLGGDRCEAVAPELGIRSEIMVDGTASYATFELVSETEICVGSTLTAPEEYVTVMLPFVGTYSDATSYDLAAHGITGFAFDITSEPSGAKTTFGVSTSYLSSSYYFVGPVEPAPSQTALRFGDFMSYPGWFTLEDPHFQAGARRLEWEFPGNGTEMVHRFCISNVRVFRD